MKKLFCFCFLLLFTSFSFAGTLSITMEAMPIPGLSTPQVAVTRLFTYIQNTVNWGDTWMLTLSAGTYRIIPFPVTDGVNFYHADSVIIFVPAIGTVSHFISYDV